MNRVPQKTPSIEQILSLLGQAPYRIAAITAGATAVQLRTAPAQDEWSANEVLAHLRSCADVWGDGITLILAQNKPTIRAVNPRTWINSTNYLELEFQPSLQAYITQRTELMAVLESLAPESWYRSATITGVGKVIEWTVFSYAERMAIHERPHIKQIERTVSAMKAARK
jgi:hypothetical protein